jgi:hypothetical protein
MKTEIARWEMVHREITYGDMKWIGRVRDLMEGLRDDGS